MNYNDKYTRLLKTKHQNSIDHFGSDRSNRREFEREFKKFESKVSFYINEDLWNCISKSDQTSIFNSWRFSGHGVYRTIDFKYWIKKEIKSIDIDKQLYRDKIIDRLLDEV